MAEGITKIQGRYGPLWKAIVNLPRDPLTGKRRRETKTFATEAEAIDWRVARLSSLRSGRWREKTNETCGDFLTRWLATRTNLKASSRNRYDRTLRTQILPVVGHVPLTDVRPEHVQLLIAELTKRGLSSGTVADAYTLLKSGLKTAVRWELIDRNPADMIDPPHERKTRRQIWTVEQIRSFLVGTKDDELSICWYLAAQVGLRRGEILGLMWSDVDFERGVLSIRHGLTEDAGRRIIVGDPKTEESMRELGISQTIINALMLQRDRQQFRRAAAGSAWIETGLVVDRGDGEHVSLNKYNQHFHKARERLGLPQCRPHDLRHFVGTSMLANRDIPDSIASRFLGHSSIKITSDIYFHDDVEMKRAAAQLLDAYIWGDQAG